VAEEEPQAVGRLVFDDRLGRELRANANALARLHAHPALQPIGDSLTRFVRAQNDLYAASRQPGELTRRIARLQEELATLKHDLARFRANPRGPGGVADNPEAVLREGLRLLKEGLPETAASLVARHVERHDVTRLRRPMLFILSESTRRSGELREPNTVVRLIRGTGAVGIEVFFGSEQAPEVLGAAHISPRGFSHFQFRSVSPASPRFRFHFAPGFRELPFPAEDQKELMDLLRALRPDWNRGGR
jgi:hypothetical protein